MNINDVIKLIFLFTKKYYRINCFKKFNSISEEFEYIPKKICLSLSKLLTILGVLFSYIIPIIVLFSSDF